MDQEKAKLQQEADSLAQRLEAVLNDKFEPRTSFDADTPIDKTLNFLQVQDMEKHFCIWPATPHFTETAPYQLANPCSIK